LINPISGKVIPDRTFKILKVGEQTVQKPLIGEVTTRWKVSIEYKKDAATEPVNIDDAIIVTEDDNSGYYYLTLKSPIDGREFNMVIQNLGGGYRRRTRRRIKKNRKNRRRYSRRK
jgi:hypothetical protein